MLILFAGHPDPEFELAACLLRAEHANCQMLTATTWEELERELSNPVDMIIARDTHSDFNLIELVRRAATLPQICPVVLLCHAGSEHLVAQALMEGLTWYAVDPLTFPNGLAFTLRVALATQHTAEAGEAEPRYRRFFLRAPVGLYRTSVDNRVLAANPYLARMLGFDTTAELLQTSLKDLYVDINDRDTWRERIDRENTVQGSVLQLRRKDGQIITIRDTGQAIRDENGQILYYEGSLEDISAQRRAEDQLLFLSMHDAMTGLFNRFHFEQELRRLQTSPEPITVVVADMDNLKQINDTLGHIKGDEAIKAIAQILGSAFRVEDMIARIGGDEFVVILPGVGPEQVEVSLERIRNRLAEHSEDGFKLRISLGAATAPNGAHLMEAFQLADKRMYANKLPTQRTSPTNN